MKLRIKGDSVRLRLGRSEVDRLADGEVVAESTTFDPAGRQRLEYRLVADPAVGAVSAAFAEGVLEVRIPEARARSWGRSDEVGIAASQAGEGGRALRILIEKDLECLDAPAHEPQDDAFRRADGADCGPADRVAVEPADPARHSRVR